MEVGILGPLEVRGGGGRKIEIAGSRLRALLVRLVLHAGRPVGVASLVEAVWGRQPPADEAGALHALVSRLRRALGDVELVRWTADGYRLAVEPDDVDAHRFERLATAGAAALRRGDPLRASTDLCAALALWRGPASMPTSCAGWTGCPWRSNWRPRGCARCRSPRSPSGSPTGSGCSPGAAAPPCLATARCAPSSNGVGTCCPRPNGFWRSGWRCSRPARRPTVPPPSARVRAWRRTTSPSCSPRCWTSRSSRRRPAAGGSGCWRRSASTGWNGSPNGASSGACANATPRTSRIWWSPAEPHLRRAEQLRWLEQLMAERDNILGALRFRCDRGDANAALRIAVGLSAMAMLLGNHADFAASVAEALAVPGGDPTLRLIGEALYALNCAMTGVQLPPAAAGLTLARFAELAERLGAVDVTAHPTVALLRPALAMFSGNDELTRRYVAQARASADPRAAAAVLMVRANIAENDGDVDTMRADTVTALAEFRALGERWGIASSLRTMAQPRILDGDLDAAAAAYEEALALMDEMGSRDDESLLWVRLADLGMRRGDLGATAAHIRSAQVTNKASGSALEALVILGTQADIARHTGDLDAARALHAQALGLFAAIPPSHPIRFIGRAIVLAASARLSAEGGDLAEAGVQLQRAYQAAVAARDMPIVAWVGVTAAEVAARRGEPVAAAEILGACVALRGGEDATALDVARLTTRLRDALGDGLFAAAYERGRAMERGAALARLTPSPVPG